MKYEPAFIQGSAACLPLPGASVDLIVTSPPYYQQRSYKDDGDSAYDGQVGLEDSPREYVDALLACTAEWTRVMKPRGSIFVNIGDKYAAYNRNRGPSRSFSARSDAGRERITRKGLPPGTRNKSLMGLPQRYMLRCMDELGLTCRAEIIWRKPHPAPERVRDRCPTAHEVIFHFTLTDRYYFTGKDLLGEWFNTVWTIPYEPLRLPPELGERNFSVFPAELPRRCIRGWSMPGAVVLDPFGGAGTTALTAAQEDRMGVSVDMSRQYGKQAQYRAARLHHPD